MPPVIAMQLHFYKQEGLLSPLVSIRVKLACYNYSALTNL